MASDLPVLRIREWSRIGPEDTSVLRNLSLNEADRRLLADLAGHSSLRVEELRRGLRIEIGPHIGSVSLSALRLVILPNLRLDRLMAMVAYAFELSDLVLIPGINRYTAADTGLVDLLGLALLHELRRLARGGLLCDYQETKAELASVRGRIDLRHAALGRRPLLRCTFAELSSDHRLHQVLASGLKRAAAVMDSQELRQDLLHINQRLFNNVTPIALNAALLRRVRDGLNRRSSHYKNALALVALILEGSRLGDHQREGELSLCGFLLDMNRVFERFLSRYLQSHAPAGMRVLSQQGRSDVFSYLENPKGWRRPAIRPDLVFLQEDETVAVGDAKYRNRHEHPPSTAELYQLTTYGLAYPMSGSREVLLFHPLGDGETAQSTQLLFAPEQSREQVWIRLVGVPIGALLTDPEQSWWPLAEKT